MFTQSCGRPRSRILAETFGASASPKRPSTSEKRNGSKWQMRAVPKRSSNEDVRREGDERLVKTPVGIAARAQ